MVYRLDCPSQVDFEETGLRVPWSKVFQPPYCSLAVKLNNPLSDTTGSLYDLIVANYRKIERKVNGQVVSIGGLDVQAFGTRGNDGPYQPLSLRQRRLIEKLVETGKFNWFERACRKLDNNFRRMAWNHWAAGPFDPRQEIAETLDNELNRELVDGADPSLAMLRIVVGLNLDQVEGESGMPRILKRHYKARPYMPPIGKPITERILVIPLTWQS
jgi:hypothetical protein